MRTAFRNVEGTASIPVGQWPYEALVATIERGTIGDWLPIIRAIERSPWGNVSRRVEEYLGYADPYGIGPLLRRTITRARAAAESREREAVAGSVRSMIRRSGLSNEEFARAIGTSRSRLSTYASGRVVPAATLLVRMESVAGQGAGDDRADIDAGRQRAVGPARLAPEPRGTEGVSDG